MRSDLQALYSLKTYFEVRGVAANEPAFFPPTPLDAVFVVAAPPGKPAMVTDVVVRGAWFSVRPFRIKTDEFPLPSAAYAAVPQAKVPLLWEEMFDANPDVVESILTHLGTPPAPSLKSILADPRWKLRHRHSSAIIHAVGVANLHDRPLDDALLFAAFLAQADEHVKADTAWFTLQTLLRQSGDGADLPLLEKIPFLLKLPGISTLHVASNEPLSSAMESATADDAARVLQLIEDAESLRTRTGTEDQLDNRHFLAALLARDVIPRDYDVDSLRRELLEFIVEHHREPRDLWRAALFVTSPFDLANRIASDVWTYDDTLGYRVYAKAIADAILKGSTTPPLTIGIQAPWGHGKTSLMRMIQLYLDPDSRQRNDEPPLASRMELKLRDFLRLLGAPDLFLRRGLSKEKKTVDEPVDGLIPHRENVIPTVWFNPLYYRERKQIWAGLAHAILHQLAQQLPSQRVREEFWLRLQFARIDVDAVRRDVQRFVLLRVLPVIAFWLIAGAAMAFLAPLLVLSSGVAAALLHGLYKANKVLREQTVTSDFARYVSEPNYAGELGLLHLVDHDLDLALRLLAGKRKIAVFIDDLDRCDPATVNEIVLAINHFLSVQNRKAFFFLGMDMAMVADALEQVHAKGDSGKRRGFGWRFMEKFVQLPFVIPHLDPETAKKFAMEQLRGVASPSQPADAPKVESIEAKVRNAKTAAEVGYIARNALGAPMPASDRARLEEAFASRTTELMADPASDEIESIAKLAVADLELNPRTIKRYFCLVRVLRNIQIATGAAQSPENDRKAILRTAHLLMNWPELAQWLRERDTSFADLESAATNAESADAFAESMKKRFGDGAPPCVADASLHRFLSRMASDGPSLTDLYAARLL